MGARTAIKFAACLIGVSARTSRALALTVSLPPCLIRVSPSLREFAEASANWLINYQLSRGEHRDE